MKKIIAILFGLLLTTSLFAQTESRKLFAGVYNFATEKSADWRIIEPVFESVDPFSEKCVFKGSFVVKIPLGQSRYDFTCTVVKQNEDFTVELSNVTSYACDKNYKILKNGKIYNTSERVSKEYAKQMKSEISKRMTSWTDDEYNQILNDTVTSPFFLASVANNSALVFKKFIKDYEIIGRTISVKIFVTTVDEAPKYAKGYEYYVAGKTLCGYKVGQFNINYPEYASIMVYTNNDNVISLVPAETMDGILGGAESGSEYEVKGVIKDVSQNSNGGLSVIEINE